MAETVVFFKRYPFTPGQKIHIEDGPRKGDWTVTAVDEKKVALRCPVSGTEVAWDRFCYFIEEKAADFPVQEG
ncbi:MAG: hypothetical protein D3924_04405 [Candidatus Electrothrix sp. AR4]|nr:hypothetical protein [Candidatus Electrothrix sp. AR4]